MVLRESGKNIFRAIVSDAGFLELFRLALKFENLAEKEKRRT